MIGRCNIFMKQNTQRINCSYLPYVVWHELHLNQDHDDEKIEIGRVFKGIGHGKS